MNPLLHNTNFTVSRPRLIFKFMLCNKNVTYALIALPGKPWPHLQLLKRGRNVTTVTLSSKTAIMYIIGGMAINTSCRGGKLLICSRALMAGIAINPLVATSQFKGSALIMIKIPNPPVTGIMTSLAPHPQTTLMNIILGMAGYTFQFGIFKRCC